MINDYIKDKYRGSLKETIEEATPPQKSKNDSVIIVLTGLSELNAAPSPSLLKYEEKELEYFYQQEPVLLNEWVEYGEKKVDYVVALGTKKTCEERIDVTLKDSAGGEYRVSKTTAQEFFFGLADEVLDESTENNDIQVYNYGEIKEEEPLLSSKSIIRYDDEDGNRNDETIAFAIAQAIKIVQYIKKKHDNSRIAIHYYNHGGLREVSVTFEAIMSLLKDPSIIVEKNILVFERPISRIKNKTGSIEDFVSGINEFRNYGKVDSLLLFYKDMISESGPEYKNDISFLRCLELISFGIQLNDIDKFIDGIKLMIDIKKKVSSTYFRDYYLNSFANVIIDELTFIDDRAGEGEYPYDVINMIHWSMDNGYYQQALTMIESLIPIYLFEKDIVQEKDLTDEFKKDIQAFSDEDEKNSLINTLVYYLGLGTEKEKTDVIGKKGAVRTINKRKDKGVAGKLLIQMGTDAFSFLKEYNTLKKLRNKSNHLHNSFGNINRTDDDLKEKEDLRKQVNSCLKYLEPFSEEYKQLKKGDIKVRLLKKTKKKDTVEKSQLQEIPIGEKVDFVMEKKGTKGNIAGHFDANGKTYRASLSKKLFEQHKMIFREKEKVKMEILRCNINPANDTTLITYSVGPIGN